MARIDDLLAAALAAVGEKPADSASQAEKKGYSERVSARLALAIAEELRARGMDNARPSPGDGGAERRMAGGIGAKKVDVTWATEESGLLLGISIKTINYRDARSGTYQKNLTNRRGDMLIEAVTLHRRFPYSVLGGLFFLDAGAATDGSSRRKSTFENAHMRFRLFTGRDDPAGRDEQFETFHLILLGPGGSLRAHAVGDPATVVPMAEVIDSLVERVAVRNPDFYEYVDGGLERV